MKWIANIVVVLIMLAGLTFFLQGTNVIPVGGMAGQGQWTVIGLVIVVVGLGALWYLNFRKPGAPQTPS
jgi:hypothetical protein